MPRKHCSRRKGRILKSKIQIYSPYNIKIKTMAKEKSYGQGLPSHTPRVSINPLIEFISASDRRKLSIVRGQKSPSTLRVAPYSTARAAIKNFIKSEYDLEQLVLAVLQLRDRDQSANWKRQDVANSIDALRHFTDMNFPSKVSKVKCTFAKSVIRDCYMDDVLIVVAPDFIMRWEIDGVRYIGAVKLRISKKQLDYSSGRKAAALLAHYLETSVRHECETVDYSHCLYVDVFAETIYPAPPNDTLYLEEICKACDEYAKLWRAA